MHLAQKSRPGEDLALVFVAIFGVAAIKLAASAASPEGKKLNFQAVIKSPASAASLLSEAAWICSEADRRRLGMLKAGAVGAPTNPGRLRSSRPDHGLKNPSGRLC